MKDQKLVIIFLILLFVVVFSTWFFSSRNKEIKNYPYSFDGPIVAFGDSLVVGVGSENAGGFVGLLSEKIGEPIINEGRSGDTTISAIQRVDDVLEKDPKMVILLLGGNDYLRRIPKEKTFENLGKMIEVFQENGAVVVVLGVRGGLLKDSYDSDFEDLSEKYQTLYVSNVLLGLLGKNEYMSDEIHPNDEGYKLIAGRVYEAVHDYIR